MKDWMAKRLTEMEGRRDFAVGSSMEFERVIEFACHGTSRRGGQRGAIALATQMQLHDRTQAAAPGTSNHLAQ